MIGTSNEHHMIKHIPDKSHNISVIFSNLKEQTESFHDKESLQL